MSELSLYDNGLGAGAQPGAAVESYALRLRDLRRSFTQGGRRLDVLRGADLDIKAGELVALIGPSGAGKSTLLHIAGLLEPPDQGEVYIGGQATSSLDDKARSALRRDTVGFIYQFHQLLPEFSALENVALPQLIGGRPKGQAHEAASRVLTTLGLGQRLDHRPGQLSGGEQQRVAVARALANDPLILLADEPTGNLDPRTAQGVFDQFLALVREEGRAALVATHNLDLAQRMDRIVLLEDGLLYEQPLTL